MHIPKQSSHTLTVICAGLVLLLCSGCVTISANTYKNMVAYEPVRSPVQIDASAAIEAVDTLTPEMRAVWKKWMNNEESIGNYLSAFGQTLQSDLATSGLFARVVPDATAKADYSVKALGEESRPSDFRFRITLTATENATGTQVSSHTREVSLGSAMFDANAKSNLTTSAPKEKVALNALYTIGDWTVNLRETIYGPSFEYNTQGDGTYYKNQVDTAAITDLDVSYAFTDYLKLTVGASNLFDQKPETISIVGGYPSTGQTALYDNPNPYSPYGTNGGYYYVRVGTKF